MLRARVEKMNDMQSRLYASNRYAVLLIFQAMDAAGKDSAIKHVMSGVNPQGCQVFSFKHPSLEELDHHFFMAHPALPPRTRAYRHLQPFLPRRSAGRPASSGTARGRGIAGSHPRQYLATALSVDPRLGGPSPPQWDAGRKIFSPSFQRGTTQAVSCAHRRARSKLEVQFG
jgi:hypothetical protein